MYNQYMENRLTAALWWRVLLPLLVAPLLGLAPQALAVRRSQADVRRSLAYGDLAAASAHLARAAARQPWRSGLWEQAGWLAQQGGDAPAAVGYLEEAARRGQLGVSSYLLLGDAYQFSGDYPAAVQVWRWLLTQPVGPENGVQPQALFERLYRAHLQLGDFEAALESLQALASLRPGDVRLRSELGRMLAASQPEAAVAHLVQAVELEPALAATDGELARAIRLAALQGDQAFTRLEAGRVLAAQQDWFLAAQAFQQALDQRPDYAEAWAFLAEARQQLDQQGSQASALADLQTALRLDPGSLSAHLFMALYWRRQGEDERSLQYLEQARELNPRLPAVQAELGETFARLGRLADAQQAFQQAAQLAQANSLYYRLLASFSVRYQYQVSEQGLPAARRAVLLSPQDAAALDVMAQVLLLQQDFASAERYLSRARQADAAYYQAWVTQGLLYAFRGELREARQVWQQVQQQAPGSPAAEQARRHMQTYFP